MRNNKVGQIKSVFYHPFVFTQRTRVCTFFCPPNNAMQMKVVIALSLNLIT